MIIAAASKAVHASAGVRLHPSVLVVVSILVQSSQPSTPPSGDRVAACYARQRCGWSRLKGCSDSRSERGVYTGAARSL